MTGRSRQAEQWALRQKSQLRSRVRVKLQKDAFDLQWMRQLEMRLADRQQRITILALVGLVVAMGIREMCEDSLSHCKSLESL